MNWQLRESVFASSIQQVNVVGLTDLVLGIWKGVF